MRKLVALLTLASAVSAVAAEYSLDFTGATPLSAEAPVVRKAEMSVAVGQIPSVAVGDKLALKLFDDVDFALKIVSAPPAGIAGQSFIAKDEKGTASAIVKVTAKNARISVDDFMNRRQYTVRCKDGKALIVESDNSQEDGGECATCSGEIEFPQPVVEETTTTSTKKSRTLLGASGDAFPVAEQKSVVDVLVAFDKGAKAWAEKGSNWGNLGDSIEEFADYAVNKMNYVLEKSQLLDKFSYRLVGVAEIDATYTSIGNQLLGNLRARVGALSRLTQLREKYGADTITLLIDKTQGNTTGIGYGYYPISSFPGPASFDGMNYACNVCDIKTVYSRYTMSHETGHNMGCDHSTRQGPTNSGPGRFEDSCGYHFVDTNGVRRYTIMGYNYTADDDYNYLPVPYFSSPDISPAEYGCAVGVEGTNNNRRTLLQTHADIAGLRDRKLPYDWDVRFLDDNGNDISDGTLFYSSTYVTLTNANPEAEIYYTLDGSTPTSESFHGGSGTKVYMYLVTGPKTLTACAVVDGKAQSVRSITLYDGHTWSGDANGNGLWLNNDSSVLTWSGNSYYSGGAVMFPDLAGLSSAIVTVKGDVAPSSVSFSAVNTAYTFDKGNDAAQITIPDANFAPAGDVTFNVPVQLSATTFTNMTGCALTFNAPFGQTIDATSGYCTNLVTISPYGTMTVAPGAGKTQSFDTLNNQNGGFSGNATFRVGEGTVIFNGGINGGAGVIGRTKLEVGNGGNLVFDVPGGGGTGYQMDQTSLTVENGGRVTYNDMELLKRTLYLDGGTIYAKRLDLMSNPGIYVTDNSAIEDNNGGYIYIRGSSSEINVSAGKTLALDIGTDYRNDTSGNGIIKYGGGTIAANSELKHNGVTDIEEGTLEVGYSSGSTVYGEGWIVASNSTLRVKSGCTLKVPSLTLDETATISLPAATSAPLIVNGNVDLTEVRLSIQEVGDLSLGASYPLISATGEISGVKSLVRASWPKPGTGLGWKLEVANGTLTASIVNAIDSDPVLDFFTNNTSVGFSLPDDASMTENGSLQLNATPIVLDGFTVNAIAATIDITLGEPSATERTICSWKIGDNIVRCVVTNGVLDCFHAVSSHVANSVQFVKLSPGRHVVNIAYKSLSDDTYGGTFVYVDGQLAYRAAGLRWSNDSVSRVTIGASAADTPAYKYEGLVVNGLSLLTPSATEPLLNMTSSGGTVSYDYFAAKSPCVFSLAPSGGFSTHNTLVSAAFQGSYDEMSVSVVAAFPETSTGTILSAAVLEGYYAYSTQVYSTQVEYKGDGIFAFRDNGGDNIKSSVQTDVDLSKSHLYTLTYKIGDGFRLYMDGDEMLTNDAYFKSKSLPIYARMIFGCGYWTNWMTSYNDNPNPMPDFTVYASHIALGTSDRTVSEAVVMASMATDEEDDDDPKPPATPATVDVLVAYDNGAQAYVANKGVTLAEFAATQIGKMNDVLATNRLDRYYAYRLAGVCKVDATYANIEAVSGDLVSGVGPLVTLRSSRELCGADTVTLLVNTSGVTLGDSIPLSSSTDVASQHECAFSVCSISAVDTGTQHTMIHENAHNMGCGHSRKQERINSPFEYGRGYYFMDGDTKRHTIMAYDVDGTGVYAHPSPYFSTASREFGFELGDVTNNNARVLKETCGEVAKWREGAAIDFDGVEVDGVTWQTSGRFPWSIGDGVIRSFNQTNYQYQCTTPLRATIEGPKALSFKHKSYFGGRSIADGNYSHFDVLLDDSPVLTQTECTNSWTEAQLVIPEGTHEVTFVFSQRFAMNNSKDYKEGTPEADDAVWLKDIILTDAAVSTELNIPAGTSVNLSDVGSAIETIIGEGTLVCDTLLPTKGYGLANDTWKGIVAFKNFNNEDAAKDFQVEKYGNANSKVQFTNCKIPYLKNNNATFAGTVVLDGDSALTTKDGYSTNYNVFGALEGDGTMSFLDKPMQWYVFNTATNFTGSINVQHGWYGNNVAQGRRIVFGKAASTDDLPTQSASITVMSGAEAAIGANATWYAYHGVEIAGTLMVKGEDSTLSCNSSGDMGVKFTDGATIRFDAAGAKLNCLTNFSFASGTVNIAFADGATPTDGATLMTWPEGSTINGKFKLVEQPAFKLTTNATCLVVNKKPDDRFDVPGSESEVYIPRDDNVFQSWLESYTDFQEQLDWGSEITWTEFLNDRGANGYKNYVNFLLGFSTVDPTQKFEAKIEVVNGEVTITTTEGTMPKGYGIVKKLYKKARIEDEWQSETMTDTTTTFDGGDAGFYKVEVIIDQQ